MNTREIADLYKLAITKTIYSFGNYSDYTEKQQEVLEDLNTKLERLEEIEDYDEFDRSTDEAIADVAERFAEDISDIIDLDEDTEFDKDYDDGRYELDGKEYRVVCIPSDECYGWTTIGYTKHTMWTDLV